MKRFLIISLFATIIFAFCSCARFRNEDTGENGYEHDTIVETPEVPRETDRAIPPFELSIHFNSGYFVFDTNLPIWRVVSEMINVNITSTATPTITCPLTALGYEAIRGFPADIYGGTDLSASFIRYGMEGYFLPLNDLIANYALNISQALEQNPQARIAAIAPDGNIYHLPVISMHTPANNAWFIRLDWLDAVGLSVPDTVQELENAMIVFRDEMPAILNVDKVKPLVFGCWLNMIRLTNLWGSRAFGSSDSNIRFAPREDSDEIFHTWTDPEFKEAIIQLSRWYNMGLIDRNVFSRGLGARFELLGQNFSGVVFDCPISTVVLNELFAETINGYNMIPMMVPINTNGERLNEHRHPPVFNQSWAISANSSDPVSMIRFFDFFFSEIGVSLLNHEQDVSGFDYAENAGDDSIRLSESLVHLIGETRFESEFRPFIGIRNTHPIQVVSASQSISSAIALNESVSFPRQMPYINFSRDEQNTIDLIEPYLNAFLDSAIKEMIIGGTAYIESRWEQFVEEAMSYGLPVLLAVYQEAFNRTIRK